jgi:hypothetical protein
MRTHDCCSGAKRDPSCETVGTGTTDGNQQFGTVLRWCLHLGGWLVPSVPLVLLPKCPACLAAYIVMGTGISLSLSTARTLQLLLLTLCIALLSYLTVRHRHRVMALIFRPKGIP